MANIIKFELQPLTQDIINDLNVPPNIELRIDNCDLNNITFDNLHTNIKYLLIVICTNYSNKYDYLDPYISYFQVLHSDIDDTTYYNNLPYQQKALILNTMHKCEAKFRNIDLYRNLPINLIRCGEYMPYHVLNPNTLTKLYIEYPDANYIKYIARCKLLIILDINIDIDLHTNSLNDILISELLYIKLQIRKCYNNCVNFTNIIFPIYIQYLDIYTERCTHQSCAVFDYLPPCLVAARINIASYRHHNMPYRFKGTNILNSEANDQIYRSIAYPV